MRKAIPAKAEEFLQISELKAGKRAVGNIYIKRKPANRAQTKADIVRKKRRLKGISYISDGHRLKLQQMYLDGVSIDRIARETGHCWRTVSKVVRAEDMETKIRELREKFYGQLDELLLAAIIGAKTRDARLAYKMVCDAGLLPPLSSNANFNMCQQQPEKETEDEAVKKIAVALVQGAIERHKYFGLPLPEAEEIEAELKANGEIGG